MASCRPTRHLGEDEYLLDRNRIQVRDSLRFSKQELEPVIKQKPNKRILAFMRFHLAVHNLATKEDGSDTGKVRTWLKEDVGEAPVIHDTAKTRRTKDQMQTYLTKKGYFRSQVRDSVVRIEEKKFWFIPYKKKRAEVYYILEPGSSYRFGTISYDLEKGIEKDGATHIREQSILEKGKAFDIKTLDEERESLTEALQRKGYYTFNKNAVHFELDSSVGKKRVAVEVEVRPELKKGDGPQDSLTRTPHHRWKLRNIYVNTDHQPAKELSIDTLKIEEGYRFIYHDKLKIDPSLLIQSIYIKPEGYYDLQKEKLSYRRLSELRIYNSVNISYQRVKGKKGVLDCQVRLGRAKTHSLSLESLGTNRGGNLGVEGNLSYKNRNIFQGAEAFSVDLSGGVESQPSLTEKEEQKKVFEGLQLNTVEFGPEISLDLPKFLLPIDPTRFARSSDPRTRFSASMNFQQRPDYTRNVASMSMSYRWDETALKKHRIDPFGLSMIRIDKSRAFQQRLEKFDDQLLLNSYQDHLIFGSRYNYTYNSQERSDQENITFLKGSFEAAGNSLQLLHNGLDADKGPNDQYHIADISYAQFLKSEADLRFYHRINSKSSLAFRFFGGVGVPYGNSEALPFQRSFYGGGANDLRAWRIRTVGPGSYTDSTFSLSFDKIGDIKLEGNAEYRFDLIDPVEGAFFIDAGNIWLLEKNEKRPGGHFRSEEVINEIGVGGGVGIRLDLDFFIVRLDFAVPLKDPELPVGERWIFQPKDRINAARKKQAEGNPDRDYIPYRPFPDLINLNLGIGYPF